ncbi:SDR family oxidoreductase [Bosea sp. TAB14]|jgi:3-oxoacyl-[acyl-carrier protein] reductase|uniref:SDR family oxidoreductase n=1 Tax=Bosea sp. TAB14 TaxID=3237481 RepID=UPI003F8FFC01
MTTEFAGQTAIVTGGARGIGLAIVKELLNRGCRVSIWDRSFEGFDIAAVDRRVVDVADTAAVAAAFSETLGALGRVDILINNAGINGPIHRVEDYPPEHWDNVIRIDLTTSGFTFDATGGRATY